MISKLGSSGLSKRGFDCYEILLKFWNPSLELGLNSNYGFYSGFIILLLFVVPKFCLLLKALGWDVSSYDPAILFDGLLFCLKFEKLLIFDCWGLKYLFWKYYEFVTGLFFCCWVDGLFKLLKLL